MSAKLISLDVLVERQGFDIIEAREGYSYDGSWSQSEDARHYFVAVIPVSRYIKPPEQKERKT